MRRFRYLFQHRRLQSELADDIEFHREMAARSGNRNFGNVLRMQEQAREAWGWMWIDRLMQDLHYAGRILLRAPGFTVAAVLVLAIGIGANLTAFSLFNLIALKPLPIRDPQSIVRLERRSPEIITGEMPYSSVAFYRDHARTLSAVMATMGAPRWSSSRICNRSPLTSSPPTTSLNWELMRHSAAFSFLLSKVGLPWLY